MWSPGGREARSTGRRGRARLLLRVCVPLCTTCSAFLARAHSAIAAGLQTTLLTSLQVTAPPLHPLFYPGHPCGLQQTPKHLCTALNIQRNVAPLSYTADSAILAMLARVRMKANETPFATHKTCILDLYTDLGLKPLRIQDTYSSGSFSEELEDVHDEYWDARSFATSAYCTSAELPCSSRGSSPGWYQIREGYGGYEVPVLQRCLVHLIFAGHAGQMWA